MMNLLRTCLVSCHQHQPGLCHCDSSCPLLCSGPAFSHITTPPTVTCFRSTHLLPENNISLHSTTNRRRIHREGESQGDWAKDNLEKNIRTSGNTAIAKNSITRSLAPSPCLRKRKWWNPVALRIHIHAHSLMLSYILEVTLSQETQWHQHKVIKVKAEDSMWIISGCSCLQGRALRDQGTCLPPWHTLKDAQAQRQVTDAYTHGWKEKDLCLKIKNPALGIFYLVNFH